MLIQGFRQRTPGRFAFEWEAPWGQSVPAEAIVVARRRWGERSESEDERWAAFELGPVVVAIRLIGTLPVRIPSRASVPGRRTLARR